MMSEAQAPQAPRKRWIVGAKILGAGALLILLTVLIPFTVMFIKACLIPAPPPAFTLDQTHLLHPQGADNAKPAGKVNQTSQTAATAAHTNQTTNQTQAAECQFRYPEFIRDMPDLPLKLRAIRDKVNHQYIQMLSKIAEFEKDKYQISESERNQRVLQIANQAGVIEREILLTREFDSSENPMEYIQESMAQQNWEYQRWFFSAQFFNAGKRKDWLEAAIYAKGILLDAQEHWMKARRQTEPNVSAQYSDYYRQMGTQDWDRVIDCYRQVGGVYGYRLIAREVFDREMQQARDWLERLGRPSHH